MSGIVNRKYRLNFDYTYYPAFESFCIKLCYFNVLQYYKIFLPISYINSVPLFSVCVDNHIPRFTYYMEPLIASQSHIAIECGDHSNIENNMPKLIEKGYPCLAKIDGYYLSYHPDYQKKHEEHVVVLYGFDHAENSVWIADKMPPYFYDGFVSKGVLHSVTAWGILDKTKCTADPKTLIFETVLRTHTALFDNDDQGYQSFLIFAEWAIAQTSLNRDSYRFIHQQVASLSNYINLFYVYMLQSTEVVQQAKPLCKFLEHWLREWRILKVSLLKSIYSSKQTNEYKDLLHPILSRWNELKGLLHILLSCIKNSI